MRSRSRVRWDELREAVLQRDLYQSWWRSEDRIHHGVPFDRWRTSPRTSCVARFLDPSGSGPCSGRLTLDHVKDEPMMGKKAPDDEQHLVSLCERHHLDTVAGSNWATSHRPLLRLYLKEIRLDRTVE